MKWNGKYVDCKILQRICCFETVLLLEFHQLHKSCVITDGLRRMYLKVGRKSLNNNLLLEYFYFMQNF